MRFRDKYPDNATSPIIAFDFDGTISIDTDNTYPTPGKVRKYAKQVINFLYDCGIKIVIWTCRDIGYQYGDIINDHITPMVEWLSANGIKYSAINHSHRFASYMYNSRKIYAHMYIDDRAFGWQESDNIMIGVLYSILRDVIGIDMDNQYECEKVDEILDYIKEEYEVGVRYHNEYNEHVKFVKSFLCE